MFIETSSLVLSHQSSVFFHVDNFFSFLKPHRSTLRYSPSIPWRQHGRWSTKLLSTNIALQYTLNSATPLPKTSNHPLRVSIIASTAHLTKGEADHQAILESVKVINLCAQHQKESLMIYSPSRNSMPTFFSSLRRKWIPSASSRRWHICTTPS